MKLPQLMRRSAHALILLLLGACASFRHSEEQAVARQFLHAAAENDSALMASYVMDPQPLEWVRAVRQDEPALLQAAADDLSVRFGKRSGEESIVDFSIPHRDGRESLGIRFVRRDGSWKVRWVQLSDRF